MNNYWISDFSFKQKPTLQFDLFLNFFEFLILINMFSFIRDRFIELEFPYQIPDCQIWPESWNSDESYKNSDKRRTRKSNEPEIVHVPREPRNNPTSESPKIIEFVRFCSIKS